MCSLRIPVFALALSLAASGAHAHGMDSVATDAPAMADPADPDPLSDDLTPSSLRDDARGPARAVMDGMKLWAAGAHLRACFATAAPGVLRQRIVRAASEWLKYANLVIDFNGRADQTCEKGRTYDLAIGFKPGGASSYVGTDSRRHMPSLNFEGFDNPNSRVASGPEREFNRVVMHEFGHAIGLEHEHQSPEAKCSDHIDWAAAENYYKQKLGWSSQDVHENLETMAIPLRAAKDALQMTEYDKKSVMQYAFPAEIFKEGDASPCYSGTNYELSDTDKAMVAKLYPKGTEEQDKVRRAMLDQLDKIYAAGGVPDEERKEAIAKVAEAFNLKLEQNNTAGRDVNAVTIQKLQQSSTGAGAANIGNVNGNVTIGAPQK
jgi:hypothetical protein